MMDRPDHRTANERDQRMSEERELDAHEHDGDEPQLARLADGSLPTAEQERLQARVDGSPRLREALAEQERGVALLRSLDAPTPPALREAIDRRLGTRGRRAGWRRSRPLGLRRSPLPVGLTAAVVAAVAVALVLGRGGPAPTVPGAARLALSAATLPAPAVEPGDPARLTLGEAGIPFPNWARTTGWRAVGARSDTLDGRHVRTVFYAAANGARVGYAIVAGPALAVPHGTRVEGYGGARFTLARLGVARLITWRRAGHTCVIAGRSVSDQTLVALARSETGGGSAAALSSRSWL